MGNSSSAALSDHGDDPLDPFDGIDTLGYRVLGVQPQSPAAKAGLVSFLDFLVGANQKMLLGSGEGLEEGDEYDDVDLPALLEENKNTAVEFLVYNIKSQQARLVSLTPSDSWGGAGLLGVTIRLDNYAGAEDRLVRVLSVAPKSPAAVAGLVPLRDFLLGTTHQTLDGTASLAALLREFQDRVVEVYVYNCDSDVVRVVALMPTLSWGGPGLLGAEVGVGYLHRLPHSVRSTEGASVQRKVRYVGGVTGPTTGSSNSNNSSGLPVLPNKKALLELEPQLEMEPPEYEEDDDGEESSTTDLSSVALEDNSAHGGGGAAAPQQQQKQKQPKRRQQAPPSPPDHEDQHFPIETPPALSKKVVVETVRPGEEEEADDDAKNGNGSNQQQDSTGARSSTQQQQQSQPQATSGTGTAQQAPSSSQPNDSQLTHAATSGGGVEAATRSSNHSSSSSAGLIPPEPQPHQAKMPTKI